VHEFGIVGEIEEQVRELLSRHNATRPIRIVVKATTQDGLSREAMAQAFEHVMEHAGWRGAELELQIEPARGRCNNCRQEFDCLPDELACPFCGSDAIVLDPCAGPLLMSVEME
jgi:hydrogenase nickel incorporation protein HypA/HybF